MTDSEELKEVERQLEPLLKKKEELKDTITKAELAKNRFRKINYDEETYYYKILSVNEDDCEVIELYIDNHTMSPCIRISRYNESFICLMSAEVISKEDFKQKYNELLNRLKL